jgi:hypothetical protein
MGSAHYDKKQRWVQQATKGWGNISLPTTRAG